MKVVFPLQNGLEDSFKSERKKKRKKTGKKNKFVGEKIFGKNWKKNEINRRKKFLLIKNIYI